MSKIKQATKHAGRGRKEEIVAELVQKIDNSSGLVFADYQGLTHIQLENLKKELKKLDATIIIAKNSLLKLSLSKSKNFADFKDNEGLNLPTATLFIGGDMVEPLKKIQKAIKDFGLPKIKFGILEGNLTDEAGVLRIASLPNRETLLAQLVGTLNSPIQGLVVALNANITKFVMTLSAIARLAEDGESRRAQSKPAVATAPTTPITQQTPSEPIAEVAAPANEPAVQPDAPVETDESADAGTETNENQTEQTQNEDPKTSN